MSEPARRPADKRPPPERDVFQTVNRTMLLTFGVIAVFAVLFAPAPLAILVLAIVIVVPIVQAVSGRFARTIYDSRGSTVPSRPAYSAAESLAVRGRFEEAIRAYEAAALEEPHDVEPWLRIARIERTDLKRPQRALDALRAARTRAQPDSPAAALISRQIAELFLRDLADPPRAMPELARLADTFPGTPTAAWAAAELAELKKAISDRR